MKLSHFGPKVGEATMFQGCRPETLMVIFQVIENTALLMDLAINNFAISSKRGRPLEQIELIDL